MVAFVNPYTFVPLDVSPERDRPAGHAVMGEDRFSGVLEVAVTAKTPLLIGGFPSGDAEVRVLPRRKDGTVIIPGSGLMGAVRSLHEALTGSCLRIVDLEWVPVHRHPPATSETGSLRLAVVCDVDGEGRARSVRLCDDWAIVPTELLPGNGGSDEGLPQTGDQWRFDFAGSLDGKPLRVRDDEHPDGTAPGDIERTGRIGPVAEDCWVLLVTDTNARTVYDRKSGRLQPLRFAAGRVGPDSPLCEVDAHAWDAYQRAVGDADDRRPASLKKAGAADGKEPGWDPGRPPEYADVWWPPRDESGSDPQAAGRRHGRDAPQKAGRRLRARSYLHVGQPVWVQVAGGQVTEIRLSRLWRYLGDKAVKERLGDAGPCADPENLCWSCRMFGSADTGGRAETDRAVQRSYRGHIRIDDLLAVGPVSPVDWRLAPLASPKPSAGQFYLADPKGNRIADQYARPGATWGSIADKQTRQIRGRKFYWRTETKAEPGEPNPARGRFRDHQSDALSGSVQLIPAGTVFTGRVTFDNLDAAEYGSLLAALSPRLLGEAGESGWEKAVTSVGGGKPFGFGSVEITVKPAVVQTAAQRYLAQDAAAPGAGEAMRAFRAAVPDRARAGWPALRHAIEFGFIDDSKVWYPPGAGERGSQDYDKSFEFFARTNGVRLSDGYRDLVVLPDASLPAAKQEVDSTAGEHREHREHREPRESRERRHDRQDGDRRHAR
jgi:CRISPR/Cas system CSM-associated protein Csm3 (group 7 of RAMP superfamily)